MVMATRWKAVYGVTDSGIVHNGFSSILNVGSRKGGSWLNDLEHVVLSVQLHLQGPLCEIQSPEAIDQ